MVLILFLGNSEKKDQYVFKSIKERKRERLREFAGGQQGAYSGAVSLWNIDFWKKICQHAKHLEMCKHKWFYSPRWKKIICPKILQIPISHLYLLGVQCNLLLFSHALVLISIILGVYQLKWNFMVDLSRSEG